VTTQGGAADAVAGAPIGGRDVAPDGSPVEVYRRLPPNGEAEIVHAAAAPDSAILELGAGAGRVTRRLVELGHPVVAVDESAEMLAELSGTPGVETVCTTIQALNLGRTFPTVLLGSHLVNTPPPQRAEFLSAARRHADRGTLAAIEVYPPGMTWTAASPPSLGPVDVALADVSVEGGRVKATATYTVDGRTWRQPFEAELLDEDGLRRVLTESGFTFDRWLDPARGWLAARAT
jgi:SAM-dependent methyltransferase